MVANGHLPIPSQDVLPFYANLDANAQHAKVTPHKPTPLPIAKPYNTILLHLKERVMCLDFVPQTNTLFIGMMSFRLCRVLNLRGLVHPSSWSIFTPCIEMPDNSLHHIQIFCLIIRALDGFQNVLWWAQVLTLAIVMGQTFSRMLNRCEQNRRRQKKNMQFPKLDRPS